MLFECRNKFGQAFAGTHYPRVKRQAPPFIESEPGFTRKDLSRDRATRVVALLDHVFRKLFRIRIAFTCQKERSGIAVLHPSGLRICELRQLVYGVITLPFRCRVTAIYRPGPVETRIALRNGAVV